MLNSIKYSETLEYSSDGKHLPIEFFMLTIPECKKIDLKLGYFSSNAIRTLAYGFAQFIHNGGVLRIITNHYLSIKDKLLISEDDVEPLVEDKEVEYLINNDLEGLAKILEGGDQHFFDCLKYLLKRGRLQIMPVKLKPNRLAHFKQGILDDGTNQVYFSGSCNFTYQGLVDNGESLSIARSWGENSEKIKVKENIENIERICNKEDAGYEYLTPEQIITVINKTGNDKRLDELIEDEINVYEKISHLPTLRKTFMKYTSDFKKKIQKERNTPKFPFIKGPRPYQVEAYEEWVKNDRKGIFAMATGTGKTITSLNCLLAEYKENGFYRALIIVPTIALIKQWSNECREFHFNKLFIINSKTKWNDEISALRTEYLLNDKVSYIILVTYASYVKPKFQSLLNTLPDDTLFIADEAHNLGAKNVLKTLQHIRFSKRIGLSATIERQYDEKGNFLINKFFNSHNSYTFVYSMEDAIKKEVLSKYKYYPHIVELTPDEKENYIKISKELAKLFNSAEKESFFDNPSVQKKLLKRKRIIHKADNKLSVFYEILKEELKERGNLKYTFVYVPEGANSLEQDEEYSRIYQSDDFYKENADDIRLIDIYTKTVRETDERLLVGQYTSKTHNRDLLLKQFSEGNLDVLTSMKCLDEGVDIPRAELAIFCASTGNPRQFIQRRGRVLRTHDDKTMAVIHDLVVVPPIEEESETFEMEQNMLKRELERVTNFSNLALNKMDTYLELKDILDHYKLNLYQI